MRSATAVRGSSPRRAIGILTFVAMGFCSCFLVSGTNANEGRRPLFEPTTISQSGSYVLTRDITIEMGPALIIDAPQVTIDLNGKSIETPSSEDASLIEVSATVQRLTIRNGHLTGGYWAISGGSTQLRLIADHLSVSEANGAIQVTARSVEIGVSTLATYQQALNLNASTIQVIGNTIRHESIHANDWSCGIALNGFDTAVLRDNTVECWAYNGQAVSLVGNQPGSSVLIDHNTITGSGTGQGISMVSGALISNNSLTGFRTGAINLSYGNTVINNRLSDAGGLGSGISVNGSDNVVRGNLVKNYYTGISVAGARNRIEDNTVVDSWEYGITVSGDFHVVRGNQVQSTHFGFSRGLELRSDSQSIMYRDNYLLGNSASNLRDEGTGNIDAGGNIY
jgi:hypothetical protein